MAASKPTSKGSTKQAPQAETKQPPKDAPKKPQDNTAAKQAPKETRTAVNNTFGKVPQNGNDGTPDNVAKAPANDGKQPAAGQPKNGAASPPGTGGKSAPADNGGKVPQPLSGTSSPGNPDQTNNDDPAINKQLPPSPEDAKAPGGDAKTPASDAKAPAGADAKAPAGGDAKAPAEPKAAPIPDPKAAPGEPGSQVTNEDDPVKTPDGKNVYLDKNKNPIPVEKDGTPVNDPRGNTYAVDKTGNYSKTADGKYSVVYARELDGKRAAAGDDGELVKDFKGINPKVVNPDGNYAKTVDGKDMVYNVNASGKIAALNDQDRLDLGPQGRPYAVNPDGSYLKTNDGKYVAYGNTPDGQYVVVDNGKLFTDNKGNPYTVTPDGKYMQPEEGKFGVLNQYNKVVAADAKTGEVVKDAHGNAYTLDGEGKYMQPEAGKYAVYNEQIGKTVAIDGNGNPVADAKGNPYLVGDDGQYAKAADGSYAVYTAKASLKDYVPIMDPKQAPAKTQEGLYLYQNKNLGGETVGVTDGGLMVRIDPKTNLMVKDPATNMPIVINNPYADRPLGERPLSPADTLAKMPKGTERGDPNQIKADLFKEGVLDKDNLYAALGKYNVLDVYDALIGSSKYGGWDKAPKLAVTGQLRRPSEAQAQAMIAALVSWQSQNGSYTPIKEGKVPFIATFDGDFDGAAFAFNGDLFVNVGGLGDKVNDEMVDDTFHELNHVKTSDQFAAALKAAQEFDNNDGASIEVVTEYLANKWTENPRNSRYDSLPGMKLMDNAVKELGGGDVNAGTDLLKRAYYMGDPVATQLFISAARKAGGLDYTPPILNPVDNDPTRPPVRPNEDPETTLKNLPQGSQRGDPMAIKYQLFDQSSNLDVDNLVKMAGMYDPRDVYDALVNSGKSGGWDYLQLNLRPGETVVHPDEAQSRQAIAAIIAWQNENGKYNPLKQGKVPSIVFTTGGDPKVGGRSADNIYINADNAPGVTLATSIFHELNHDATSDQFESAYPTLADGGKAGREIVTEYLANNWSGTNVDTAYERELYKEGFAALEDAVLKMGNGDRNTGMDMLKRAYFAGDAYALKLLTEYFPQKDYAVK